MTFFKRRLLSLAGVALGIIALSTPAHATLMVNIGGTIAGGTVVGGNTFVDNGPEDANPSVGILDIGAYLDSVAVNFVINGFSTTSASPIASLSLNANGNLEPAVVLPFQTDIFVTDTDFSVPDPGIGIILGQTVNLLSSIGGLDANAWATGYYGPSNTEFDVSDGSTGLATSVLLNGIGNNTPAVSPVINGPNPYSLTSAIRLQIVSRGFDPIQNIQINANLSASQIPEPTTITLIGAGLIAFGLIGRKRFV